MSRQNNIDNAEINNGVLVVSPVAKRTSLHNDLKTEAVTFDRFLSLCRGTVPPKNFSSSSQKLPAVARAGPHRSCQEIPGAAWSSGRATRCSKQQPGAARSCQTVPGAARSSPGAVGCSQQQPGAIRSFQEVPGAAWSSAGAARSLQKLSGAGRGHQRLDSHTSLRIAAHRRRKGLGLRVTLYSWERYNSPNRNAQGFAATAVGAVLGSPGLADRSVDATTRCFQFGSRRRSTQHSPNAATSRGACNFLRRNGV